MSLTSDEILTLLGTNNKELYWLINNRNKLYTTEERKKKDGRIRYIQKPRRRLKEIQRRVYDLLLKQYPLPITMCGGVVGKSIIENVKKHLNKNCVITLDIRDFYPSIKPPYILNLFKKKLGLDPALSATLMKITTYQYQLPQGAPTSPMLSNLYVLDAHKEIVEIASRNNIDVTFFIDDIALSGDNPRTIIDDIANVLRKYKLKLKQVKKHIMPRSKEQIVTGILLGKELLVTKDKMDEFMEEIRSEKSSKNIQRYKSLTSGILGFVKMVNKQQYEELKKYVERQSAPTSVKS